MPAAAAIGNQSKLRFLSAILGVIGNIHTKFYHNLCRRLGEINRQTGRHCFFIITIILFNYLFLVIIIMVLLGDCIERI